MPLPNFLVVGASKCGTSSLHAYLAQHPEVFVPTRKEHHYFSYPALARRVGGPGDAEVVRRLCSSFEEYRRAFDDAPEGSAKGEVSPSYLFFAETAIPRIKERLGNPRIVVCLRDPVEKAFSQYCHLRRRAREFLDFEEALDAEPERRRRGFNDMWLYEESGRMAESVAAYRSAFGAERVHVILLDDLAADTAGTLRALFAFLGVEPSVEVDTSRVMNRSGLPRSRAVAWLFRRENPIGRLAHGVLPSAVVSELRERSWRWNTGRKPPVPPGAAARLRKRLAPDVRRMEEVLGTPLPWGSGA